MQTHARRFSRPRETIFARENAHESIRGKLIVCYTHLSHIHYYLDGTRIYSYSFLQRISIRTTKWTLIPWRATRKWNANRGGFSNIARFIDTVIEDRAILSTKLGKLSAYSTSPRALRTSTLNYESHTLGRSRGALSPEKLAYSLARSLARPLKTKQTQL